MLSLIKRNLLHIIIWNKNHYIYGGGILNYACQTLSGKTKPAMFNLVTSTNNNI